MAKYQFTKDYSAVSPYQKTSGTLLPTIDFKAGQVISAIPNNDGKTVSTTFQGGMPPSGETLIAVPTVSIPLDALVPYNVQNDPGLPEKAGVQNSVPLTTGGCKVCSWWTNMSGINKGILIVAVAVGGYFALKHFKVIK